MSETILQEAQRLVYGDRGADYGHPLDDFTRTATMWSVILGTPVTAEQVGLCMIAVKLSRQVNHPKRDNMTDAAGYAGTVQMCIEERARRAISVEPPASTVRTFGTRAAPGPIPAIVPVITPLIRPIPEEEQHDG